MKILIVYETKYGNTKIAAETIIEGVKDVPGTEAELYELGEIEINKIPEYDTILIGSPNHMGGPTRGVKKFIDALEKLNLETKKVAVFDTYMGKDFEKAVKKMEKKLSEKAPALKQIAPGLSILVKGMKGPIPEEELPKCREFGKTIAT